MENINVALPLRHYSILYSASVRILIFTHFKTHFRFLAVILVVYYQNLLGQAVPRGYRPLWVWDSGTI